MKRQSDTNWNTTAKRPRGELSFDFQGLKVHPSVADVRHLIIKCLTEDGENPKWIFLKSIKDVKHATVCLVPNMDILQMKKMEKLMPTIRDLYETRGTVMKPMHLQRKTSLMRELLASKQASRIPYGYSHPATSYLASPEELERNRFPPGCYGGHMEEGWVRSAPSSAPPEMSHLLGIDCEMVETDQGSGQLARVSVVDSAGRVLMDRLCRPPGRVTNYLTQFSGITEEMLNTTSLTLADLQEELIQIVTPTSVLVGHSLENDLWSLKLVHPYIIDTSLLFPHHAGWPKKQSLVKLGMTILSRNLDRTHGHNSIEDARLAMLLVMTKIKMGPLFGCNDPQHIGPLGALLQTHIFDDNLKNLPEKWLTEKSMHISLNPQKCNEWPSTMRMHKSQVNIITLRTFQNGGGTDESAKQLDAQVKSIMDICGDNELFIILTCGDLEDYWRLVDDQKEKRANNQNEDPTITQAREELLQRKILHSRGRLDRPLGIFLITHRDQI